MRHPPYTESLLLERGPGFHFLHPPPADIRDPRYLVSPEPREVIAAVLAHARAGNFGAFDHLLRLMLRDEAAWTWNACTNLLSYAAPFSTIRKLVRAVLTEAPTPPDPGTRWYLCRILSGCKGLWAVPVILDVYSELRAPEQADLIPTYLSYLLEPTRGPIADGPPALPAPEPPAPTGFTTEEVVRYDLEGFRAAVLARYTELRAVVGAGTEDRTAVFEGEPLSLDRVARRLLGRLRVGEDADEIEIGRMIFEAHTGVNCAAFYKPLGPLQPLAAAAIVEDYLESGDAARFEPGVRYFFGHRIPD